MQYSKQFKTAPSVVLVTLKRNAAAVFVSAMDFLNMKVQTLTMNPCLSLVQAQSKYFIEIK